MALDRNNKKFTMATPNTQTLGELLGELGELLRVPRRSDGKYYLSDMCQSLNINPWARNKPFRYSAWNFASDAERAAARGKKASSLNDTSANNGFGPTPTIHVADGDITHGVYDYRRPRGGESEPNRLRDFAGYWHNATTPMQITWGELLLDGNSAVSILFHNSGNGWNETDCLRVDEMLDSYKANEPFALLIVGGEGSYLLPSTVTPADVAAGRVNTVTIAYGADAAALQGNSSNAQGSYLLNLNPSYLGSEYAMAIVTSPTPAPSINPLNGLRDPLPAKEDFGSLEFRQGTDRTYLPMSWLQSLKGLTYKWTANNWGYLQSGANPNTSVFSGAYELMGVDTLLELYTPAAWYRTYVTVNVTITMVGAQVYTKTHSYVGGNAIFDTAIYTSQTQGSLTVPKPSGTFQDNVLKEQNIYNYLFCIPKGMSSTTATMYITVELQAKYDNRVVDRISVIQKTYTLSIP